jgi:CheY-like chemotaxis protein
MAKVVLVVEDDPKSMKVARDLLAMSGYSTIQASDGAQGVELARAQKPDLVLMDIMMPKMDGYTACHAIKSDKATKDIPVIMVTAVGFDLNRQLAERVGASAYVTKPIDREELMKTIGQFLGAS